MTWDDLIEYTYGCSLILGGLVTIGIGLFIMLWVTIFAW